MDGQFLLDTNVAIALLEGDAAVLRHLGQETRVLLSTVVLGELYYGARKSSCVEDNLARIHRLAASTVVLGCDLTTAYQYSVIKNQLRLKGRPIPENDIWLAAIAMQYDLAMVSRDKHFGEVDGLTWEQW